MTDQARPDSSDQAPEDVIAQALPVQVETDAPAQPGIRIHGLTKHFGEIEAVAGVELDVPQGAVFGLLGPDGAGKSTLIRMLATVLLPDAGDAEVFGISAAHSPDRLTPRIGYMAQRFSMYPDLSVAENLEFFARVRGVPKPRRRERAAELLESMGMAPFAGRQARLLSGGMKQKLMLASTLMHDPDLLLLDEPTTGVDPVSRREFWRILAGIHAEGRTVLVATPYMDEAERCTHVGFMDAGRIAHAGTPRDLKDDVPGTLLEITASDPRAALAAVRDLPSVTQAHLLGNAVRVLVEAAPGASTEPGVARALREAAVDATVRPIEMDMESVFAYLAERVPA
ncbi:MAG: ABC transporter ATP-binding protein [Propionicimonas sp.]